MHLLGPSGSPMRPFGSPMRPYHADYKPTLNAVMNSLSAAPSSSSMCTRLRRTSSLAASNVSAAGRGHACGLVQCDT